MVSLRSLMSFRLFERLYKTMAYRNAMSSDCLNCSKICLTEFTVSPISSTFICLADKLTKAIAYRNAMSSDCLNCSKIC